MAKRSKEEALETREAILDAAVEVFHEHGVARPSLTEVARRAGVTRGAIYGHFTNKADLFNALCDRIRLPAETMCEDMAAQYRGNPLGELREHWGYLFRTVNENRQWQQILEIIFHRCELITESGDIHDRMMRSRAEVDTRLVELLEEAVAVGQLPPDLDVAIAAPFLHNSLVGVLEDWVLQPRDYDLGQTGLRYIDALLDMLRLSPALRRGR